MRTTLTLDPDVARLLEEERHRRRAPFKQIVNEAIRRGLTQGRHGRGPRYSAPVFHAELLPGVDPAGFNRLSDEIATDEVVRTLRR